jgi:leucyl-tRNA synthetase
MGAPWSSTGIEGTYRWLKRTWSLITDPGQPGACPEEVRQSLRRKLHQTLRRVTHDFRNFEFNTVVSSLMELLNEMGRARESGAYGTPEWDEAVDYYLRMLAPVCPHISEELWQVTGKKYSIHLQPWPTLDEAAAAEETITIPVQVNGKLRDRLVLPVSAGDEEIRTAALASEAVIKILAGKPPRKVIVAQGRLVNIVV